MRSKRVKMRSEERRRGKAIKTYHREYILPSSSSSSFSFSPRSIECIGIEGHRKEYRGMVEGAKKAKGDDGGMEEGGVHQLLLSPTSTIT